MKSALLLVAIFCCHIATAQNAPNIRFKNNRFNGQQRTKYESLNYIDYIRDTLKAANLRDEIKVTFNKIKTGSDGEEDLKLRAGLIKKEAELKMIVNRKDSLWNEYVKNYLEFSPITLGFWQDRSQALYDLIYRDKNEKRFNLLTNTGFNIGNNTGSVYSEIVSGQMYIFRVSLGAMVASSSSKDSTKSKQEEAFQRLTTYGGNTVLTLEYPLIYAHSANNQALLLSRLITKGAADFPAFGTTSDKWAGNMSFGLDLYADVATSNNKIRFFTNLNWNKYYATSTFKNNLSLQNNDFSLGQLKVGLTFSNVSLSFIVATFSSEAALRNKNIIIGGQIHH
ncbi:hypothetical protein [Sphingobacterium anhuiense]|uniref:hypothetical protein n=1 Tax=Sphingobacterium anhuiense TaxID=493780 RepID=UPI003C30CB95